MNVRSKQRAGVQIGNVPLTRFKCPNVHLGKIAQT